MKRKLRVGIDYHGCITRLPFPFNWFYRNLGYSFTLPISIRWIIWKLSVLIPQIEDRRLMYLLSSEWEMIIISGPLDRKLKLIKKYKIRYYVDDQLSVISYLKKKGIAAIDIKEIRKYYEIKKN